MKPRSSLLLGVLVAAVVAAVLGFVIVNRFAPDAARTRVFVDLGLIALLAGVVVAFTRTPTQRIQELSEALRELTRGIRSRRLAPDQFGDLEPAARAFNDVAAFLSEHDDPNLGPIKSTPRYQRPESQRPEGRKLGDHSLHPELGPVRVLEKEAPEERDAEEPDTSERPASTSSRARSAPPPATSAVEDRGDRDEPSGAIAAAVRGADDEGDVEEVEPSPSERPERDTFVDEASAEEPARTDEAPSDDSEGEPPAANDDDEAGADEQGVRELFDAFVAAKLRREEPVDELDFDAFAETLAEERDKLLSAHKCRDVRFEITVQDGEVSLLPRLLR